MWSRLTLQGKKYWSGCLIVIKRCGLSEGNTISLGYYEQDDIEDVLNYAIKNFKFIDTNRYIQLPCYFKPLCRIGIWGRCMGAVSAILFTARTNCISVLVLDSPFPDFISLIRDYIQRVKVKTNYCVWKDWFFVLDNS